MILLVACGAPAKPPPAVDEQAYWKELRFVIPPALDQIRLFNDFDQQLATHQLYPEQYKQIMTEAADETTILSQRLLKLHPPASASAAHRLLVNALDKLVLATQEARAYAKEEKDSHLITIFAAVEQSQLAFSNFIHATSNLVDVTAFRQQYTTLGQVKIIPNKITDYELLLGPYDTQLQAQAAAAKVKPPLLVTPSPPYGLIVGSFSTQALAEKASSPWSVRGYHFQIHPDDHYQFSVQQIAPPLGHLWRESAWKQQLTVAINQVTVSAKGTVVVLATSAGNLGAWDSAGHGLWGRKLKGGVSAMQVSGQGTRLLAAGYDVTYINTADGATIWNQVHQKGDGLFLQSALSDDGRVAVARVLNGGKGVGHIYAFGTAGELWRTRNDIDAHSGSLQPSGASVAVASVSAKQTEIFVISGSGQRLQRFSVPGDTRQLVVSTSGQRIAVLSDQGLYWYDTQQQKLLWSVPLDANLLSVSPDEQRIYVGGAQAISAYSAVGKPLWSHIEFSPAQLASNNSYLAILTDRRQVVLYSRLGDQQAPLLPSHDITYISLSSQSNALTATSRGRVLYFWQLPLVKF